MAGLFSVAVKRRRCHTQLAAHTRLQRRGSGAKQQWQLWRLSHAARPTALSKYSEHLIGSIGDGKSVLMAPQRSDKAGRPPPLSGDARFSKMYSDPRFARTPKKKAAVEIDARFAGMRRQGVLLSACCDRSQAAPVAVTVYPRSPR